MNGKDIGFDYRLIDEYGYNFFEKICGKQKHLKTLECMLIYLWETKKKSFNTGLVNTDFPVESLLDRSSYCYSVAKYVILNKLKIDLDVCHNHIKTTIAEIAQEITSLEMVQEHNLCLLSILSVKVAALVHRGNRPSGTLIKKKLQPTTTAITSIASSSKKNNTITDAISKVMNQNKNNNQPFQMSSVLDDPDKDEVTTDVLTGALKDDFIDNDDPNKNVVMTNITTAVPTNVTTNISTDVLTDVLNNNDDDGNNCECNAYGIDKLYNYLLNKLIATNNNDTKQANNMISMVIQFLKLCIMSFGVSTMRHYFKQAQQQAETEEEEVKPRKVDLSTDTLVFIDDRILNLYDPVLVLEPGKKSGYDDDVIIIHLTECDIYYCKNLKTVVHRMAYKDALQQYSNVAVREIGRGGTDFETENVGIYRFRNNKEKIGAILTVAMMNPDKSTTDHMNWNLHSQHLQKNSEKDEIRDGNSPPTRKHFGIGTHSYTKDDGEQSYELCQVTGKMKDY